MTDKKTIEEARELYESSDIDYLYESAVRNIADQIENKSRYIIEFSDMSYETITLFVQDKI